MACDWGLEAKTRVFLSVGLVAEIRGECLNARTLSAKTGRVVEAVVFCYG